MSDEAATIETDEAIVEAPAGEGEGAKEPVSIQDAISKALASVNIETPARATDEAAAVLRGEDPNASKEDPEPEAEAKPEKPEAKKETPKAEEKPKAERGEDGKFKAKDQPKEEAPAAEVKAPERFSKDAQAEWAKAPESVRNEVNRALSEMEGGLEKYRESADKYERLKDYEQLAERYGTSLEGVLADYRGMSDLMQQNPLQVFEQLATRHGYDFKEIAAHVLDMSLDEGYQQVQNENKQLRQELARLQQFEQQAVQDRHQTAIQTIEQFKAENPRFDELEGDIKWILETHPNLPDDPRQRLQAAYDRADRLNPAPVEAPVAPVAQTPDLSAQTAIAGKSVRGGPRAGSNPAGRGKTPTTAREASKRALAAAGLL